MELNEQTLEQILIRQREEYEHRLEEVSQEDRRHMGVLIEGLEAKIQLIAEGHDSLRQDTRGIREQLTDLQERVARLEGQVVAIRDMAAKNTKDIEAIKTDIEIIKSELAVIRHDLKDKAGRDELAAMESRVADLESTLRAR